MIGRTESSRSADRDEMTVRVERHLPLVRHIVFQLATQFPRHVEREELVRAGALGLVEAARRFDPGRGIPFERFAANRIRGAILDAARAADWAPRSLRALSRRLEQVEQDLAARLGRVPDLDEVAGELGMAVDDLRDLQHRTLRSVVLALEAQVVSGSTAVADEDLTLGDLLRDRSRRLPDEELEFRELRGYLRDAVRLLPERQRLVIVGYFLEGRSSLELAEFLGVTESRVSQLRSEALEMLREGIAAQYRPVDEAAAPAVAVAALTGRATRRRASYASAIASASAWRARLSGQGGRDGEPVALAFGS